MNSYALSVRAILTFDLLSHLLQVKLLSHKIGCGRKPLPSIHPHLELAILDTWLLHRPDTLPILPTWRYRETFPYRYGRP